MRALILSAGRGERLRPLTDTLPKPLLEIGHRPLIHYALLMLARAGVKEVAINTHHLGDTIRQKLGDGRELGVAITYAPEPKLLGTGGPLAGLRGYFGTEPFLVLNSDTIVDVDLEALHSLHRERAALATFVVRRPEAENRYSRFEVDADSRLRRMRLLDPSCPGGLRDFPPVPWPSQPTALLSAMFCGMTLCDPEVLALLPPVAPPFSLVGDLFAPMLRGSDHPTLCGYVYSGYFRTLDDLESYRAIRAEFESRPPALSYLA